MHFVLMFQLIFFFRILRSWKSRFSHRSISPHEVFTKEFQVLGGHKSCKELKWSKNFIFMVSKLQLFKLEIPIFIYNIMGQSTLINKSFISVLWIYSCNELIWLENYYFSTINISNSQTEILVSYSRSTKVNVNMSFPKSQFEWNFSTYVIGNSFWYYRVLKSECWTSRNLLCKKY